MTIGLGTFLLLWSLLVLPIELPDNMMPVPPILPSADKMPLPAKLPIEFVQLVLDA